MGRRGTGRGRLRSMTEGTTWQPEVDELRRREAEARGMAEINQSSVRPGSSSGAVRSGTSKTDEGRYDRNQRVRSNASSSESTTSLTVPLTPCIAAPPSSSFVTSSPRCLTSGGPATNTCDCSRTIRE